MSSSGPPESSSDDLPDTLSGSSADLEMGPMQPDPPTIPGFPLPQQPAELPPELVNHPRYKVRRVIGRGGMGTVYLAEHGLMKRKVALKVIQASVLGDDVTTLQRFLREMEMAAALSHPNIVTAFDAEQIGDAYFLAMEYVDGCTLAQLVLRFDATDNRMPITEACEYIRQAALGLQHAHDKDMIHRDIKPGNLMLTADGKIKILDFGLARAVAARVRLTNQATLTRSGYAVGTADYMAPEQARSSKTVDFRADIYSLGCTLYHLLSNRPPFPGGTSVEKILMHMQQVPDALGELRPDLPPNLVQLVERMMAKEPDERPSTAAEVATLLEPFAKGDFGTVLSFRDSRRDPLEAATSKTPFVDAARSPKRRWVLLGIGLLVAAMLLWFLLT